VSTALFSISFAIGGPFSLLTSATKYPCPAQRRVPCGSLFGLWPLLDSYDQVLTRQQGGPLSILAAWRKVIATDVTVISGLTKPPGFK